MEKDPIQSEWLGYFNEKSREKTELVFQLAQENEEQEQESVEEIEDKGLSGHNLEEIDGGNWYWYVKNNPILYIDPDGFAKKVNENSVANGTSCFIIAKRLYEYGNQVFPVGAQGKIIAAGCYLGAGLFVVIGAVDVLVGLAGGKGAVERTKSGEATVDAAGRI